MKKIYFAMFLTICLSIAAFAGVNEKAVKKFNDTYASATNVQWSSGPDYTKASFLNNGQRMEAYYDINGEPIALCRYLTENELPGLSLQSIKEKYPTYTIHDVMQYESSTDGVKYYVKLSDHNKGKNKVLAVSSQGNISVYKRSSETVVPEVLK